MPRFDANKYRAFHRRRGEGYGWIKGIPTDQNTVVVGAGPDGILRIDQNISSDYKALVWDTSEDTEVEEFGLIPKGTTMISVMPDETPLSRLDWVYLTQRTDYVRALNARTDQSSDPLRWGRIAEVLEVRRGTTVYTRDVHYEQDGDSIVWLSGAPSEGDEYSVELRYYPTYECHPLSQELSRVDKNGLLMPLQAMLKRLPLID